MKTRQEILDGLGKQADSLKGVIKADKTNKLKSVAEPSFPVGGNVSSPVSPPPSTIKTQG